MKFDQETIREIHARVEIAAFIGAYVQLRKRGNDLVGLCPFHAEKTPSFHVHPDRGFFKCFGCDAGGDVITFASKIENLAFPEAVRLLAARTGIELRAEEPGAERVRSEREAIYDANRLAATFFEQSLRGDGGKAAREYCERRGFAPATIEKFHLGYAPEAWEELTAYLRSNGVDLHLAAKAGLLKPSQRGGFYDFYRGRLMVPTYSTTGEVIAFGGRSLGDAEPKYLNTATTPVYTKGRHLFALNLARRAAGPNRTMIVVEGYLDCIALHQAGFDNAVASLGTAFTAEQANELRKYAENVFLCFDGDAAGEGAAVKALEIATRVLEHAGTSVRIVILPAKEDPDSFVRANGADAFRQLLASAIPAIEFRLEREVERLRAGFGSPADVVRGAERVIREMTPVAEWDRWRVWIAKRLQVNENDLRNSRFLAERSNFVPRSATRVPSRHLSLDAAPSSFEREVLAIYLEEPRLVGEYAQRIPPERFRNQVYKGIYERIVAGQDRLEEATDLFALFADEPERARELATLAARDRSSTVRYADSSGRREHLDRVVERLQLEDRRQRYQELSAQMEQLYASGDAIPDELRTELKALTTKLKK